MDGEASGLRQKRPDRISGKELCEKQFLAVVYLSYCTWKEFLKGKRRKKIVRIYIILEGGCL